MQKVIIWRVFWFQKKVTCCSKKSKKVEVEEK